MITSQERFRSPGRGLAALVMMLGVFGFSVTPISSIASASSEVSFCVARQLAVAVVPSRGGLDPVE
jgi:hypothetical protein